MWGAKAVIPSRMSVREGARIVVQNGALFYEIHSFPLSRERCADDRVRNNYSVTYSAALDEIETRQPLGLKSRVETWHIVCDADRRAAAAKRFEYLQQPWSGQALALEFCLPLKISGATAPEEDLPGCHTVHVKLIDEPHNKSARIAEIDQHGDRGRVPKCGVALGLDPFDMLRIAHIEFFERKFHGSVKLQNLTLSTVFGSLSMTTVGFQLPLRALLWFEPMSGSQISKPPGLWAVAAPAGSVQAPHCVASEAGPASQYPQRTRTFRSRTRTGRGFEAGVTDTKRNQMAHRYDVSLKALFLREGDGIMRRLLFGGKVTEHLATEQPQIFNHRADMVVRTEDGSLHQVEFQTSNETGFAVRMLEYYAYLVRVHKQHIVQTVLYLGPEPLRLDRTYTSPSMDFRFEIVNLREFEAEPLLASEDWADNALATARQG